MEKYGNVGQATITIWRMRIACWIHKATDTRSEFVVLFAFALLKGLQASGSMLLYMYIAFIISTASTSTLDPFVTFCNLIKCEKYVCNNAQGIRMCLPCVVRAK